MTSLAKMSTKAVSLGVNVWMAIIAIVAIVCIFAYGFWYQVGRPLFTPEELSNLEKLEANVQQKKRVFEIGYTPDYPIKTRVRVGQRLGTVVDHRKDQIVLVLFDDSTEATELPIKAIDVIRD